MINLHAVNAIHTMNRSLSKVTNLVASTLTKFLLRHEIKLKIPKNDWGHSSIGHIAS
jgi:hypothetical protein